MHPVEPTPPQVPHRLFWAIILLLIGLLWLSSCRTRTEVVPQPYEVRSVSHDTLRLRHYRWRIDTTYIRDSVVLRADGTPQTVYRYQYREWSITRGDTVYRTRIDTVPHVVQAPPRIIYRDPPKASAPWRGYLFALALGACLPWLLRTALRRLFP